MHGVRKRITYEKEILSFIFGFSTLGLPFNGSHMTKISPLLVLVLICMLGCGPASPAGEEWATQSCICKTQHRSGQKQYPRIQGALLASRFATLEDLKKEVEIEYDIVPTDSGEHARVKLRHCSNGLAVVSILETGVSEGDFTKARDGGIWKKAVLGSRSPFAVSNRRDLKRIYLLSRRRPPIFGEGDVAFFDLAETSVKNINTPELAYLIERDSSEKGYLNSFNHMTAQAFITSFFSEEMADFVADVHERHHMPALMTGEFTPDQLVHPDKNPMDNYVDIVNNEWGQELGKKLKLKYQIVPEMKISAQLLTDYLNDIQSYYSWAFQIGFEPYRKEDEVVFRFVRKMNRVLEEASLLTN